MLGTITANKLNIRSLPDQHSNRLGFLVKGTQVHIVGQKNGWYEIDYQNLPGFLFGHFVDLNDENHRQVGVINTDVLNIRQRPNITSPIIGSLAFGAKIEVTSSNEAWVEFLFKETTAFVARQFVNLFRQDSERFGVVTANWLNVRSAPSKNASVLGHVRRDEKLDIQSKLGSWYEIQFNHSTGFVSEQYVLIRNEDEIHAPIPIENNGIEEVIDEQDESDRPVVAKESAEENLVPSKLLTVSGNSEEKKVATTWNRYGGLLEKLSHKRALDPACAVAVLCVESSGRGFSTSNNDRMIIRFENHKLWKFWGKRNPQLFRKHFRYNSHKVWTGHEWRANNEAEWQKFHGKQKQEWQVLEFARGLDNDAALMSISMGAPQIMGFHFEAIGYQSVQEMFDEFSHSIAAHIEGMFNFMSPAMIQSLQRLDFEGFAARYNGSGQKVKYGRWIKNHFDAFKRKQ